MMTIANGLSLAFEMFQIFPGRRSGTEDKEESENEDSSTDEQRRRRRRRRKTITRLICKIHGIGKYTRARAHTHTRIRILKNLFTRILRTKELQLNCNVVTTITTLLVLFQERHDIT